MYESSYSYSYFRDSRKNRIPAIQSISRRSSQMIGTLLNRESLIERKPTYEKPIQT